MRSTSKSASASCLALTLTCRLICGPSLCCCRERGALGFSNEKSLQYCARAFSAGRRCPALRWLPRCRPWSSMLPRGCIGRARAERSRQRSVCRRRAVDLRATMFSSQGSKILSQLHSLVAGQRWMLRPQDPICEGYTFCLLRHNSPAASAADGQAHNGSTMQDSFDITTLIFIVLAVFVVWRLRSVLGQKTGNEQPPFDPISRRDAALAPGNAVGRARYNVVRLAGRQRRPPRRRCSAAAERWKGIRRTRHAHGPGSRRDRPRRADFRCRRPSSKAPRPPTR